ncbi:spermidine/putrescine ABC transporter ATP-binding protein [Paracoccus halophilus]|uniref:Spermidine/putrescine ABC transporter ATP-binding protein n=1 Tax=Paracoccus halophilus TaxID=376733 RepID=A0A099EVV3_9RHOB|nr:spermidine/putrescine ABC transporter ATP-binding protein [Paracoccus halophilus]
MAKRYPGQRGPALGETGNGVSFDVDKGELFALLGPSGCGKTTTLRIIGGFVTPDKGSVLIDDQDVTGLPAHRRPTNTVFQSYALFPHMRLGANTAFGLEMAGIARKERDERVSESLQMVGLGGMEKSRVSELSGGQQQRAALARALATGPKILLLDEPLGALDLKLRRQMQDEIVRIKEQTGTTFIHVTHDQEEACAMADRIAIMDRGRIAQIDTPEELYRSPRTAYVAKFINAGTVIAGDVQRAGSDLRMETPDFTLEGPAPGWLAGMPPLAAVLPRTRAEIVDPGGPLAVNQIDGVIRRRVFTGSQYELQVATANGTEIEVVAGLDFADLHDGNSVRLGWRRDDVKFVVDSDAA